MIGTTGTPSYTPETGRWLSRDPIGEKGGVNNYALIFNNALNLIDFLGLIDCDEFAKFFESKENLAKMFEMMEKLRKLHAVDNHEHGVAVGIDNGKLIFGTVIEGTKESVPTSKSVLPETAVRLGVLHTHPEDFVGPVQLLEIHPSTGKQTLHQGPDTALSDRDIIDAYGRGEFIVANTPNGDNYYYYPTEKVQFHPNSSKIKSERSISNGVYGKF